MSPIANTSGCPGSEQSGSTAMRPARSHSAPVASASILASGDACTPAAQILVRAATCSTSPSCPLTSTPWRSTSVTMLPGVYLDPLALQAPSARLRGEAVAEAGEYLLASVEQQHPSAL